MRMISGFVLTGLIWGGLLTSPLYAADQASATWGQMAESAKQAVKQVAKRADEAVNEISKPRMVPKGAKPEIIIKGSAVTYNGKSLPFGGGLKAWEKILGAPSRRFEDSPPSKWVWDDLGLSILTGQTKADKGFVIQFTIIMNKRTKESWEVLPSVGPDGKTVAPTVDDTPQKPFPGYLELDAFGIDAQTRFSEIARMVKPERKLHCGWRDCSHPAGALGDGKGVLYLTLNHTKASGNIYEFSIAHD